MISVVIPAYNEEEYIGQVLDSLVNQTTDVLFDAIIVDNNSTDRTVKIAQKYSKKLDLSIIPEKKQGIIHARNRGFDAAKGDIMVKLDADTRLAPQALKLIEESFRNEQVMAVGASFLVYDLPVLKGQTWPSRFFRFFFSSIVGHEILFGPCYALRKTGWNAIRSTICLDDAFVLEDIDAAMHIQTQGRIAFVDEPIILASSRRVKNNPRSFFGTYLKILLSMKKYHRSR